MNQMGMLLGALIFGISFFRETKKKKPAAAAPAPSTAPTEKIQGFQPAGDSPEKTIAELEAETSGKK